MSEDRQVIATATTYTVSLLPDDDINHGHYAITVEYRGDDRWAVMQRRWCLGTDGGWEYEMQVSEREDDWLATHRFPLEQALELAKAAAPDVEVNGRTAAEVLARRATREVTP
jgi:hypothetical protein